MAPFLKKCTEGGEKNTQQRSSSSDSANTYTQPTQPALLENFLQPAPHGPCRELLYAPRGVKC